MQIANTVASLKSMWDKKSKEYYQLESLRARCYAAGIMPKLQFSSKVDEARDEVMAIAQAIKLLSMQVKALLPPSEELIEIEVCLDS